MSKIHIKGRILQLINEAPKGIWDYEVAEKILLEYGLNGAYWKGTVRVTLTDLFSSGLIDSLEEKLDEGQHFGPDKVLFKFRMTDFGVSRLVDTHLI
ncbi:hypothetical protein [Dehalobacterium formicoaceticum]|uniref:Uncharacterized protein n=1 Tax=Dehalobacterium formicoaceticum TaxID=51515 RepID=A0ABT1Y469_9FIRM|nr:hypothetical protein [Dehalobacterium formicoaceticum]MCR6545668.1 hypothetical protein [Dehalobacterium formicoaceticum]